MKCRHEENKRFLRDYLSDREPETAVEPTGGDLDRIRRELERMDRKQGAGAKAYSEAFLENNAIHALAARALLPFGVLLFHGSALCMDGEAVIFTAPSGVGKSTQARLWREAFRDRTWMINDDKPLLGITEERVTVYGSPWDGKHRMSRNASAPLRAILKVERSTENRLTPLPGPDAFQTLTRQSFLPDDPEGAALSLAMQKSLLGKAAFYRLECNMTRDAAETARRGVFGP